MAACPQSQVLKAAFEEAAAGILYSDEFTSVLAGATPGQSSCALWSVLTYYRDIAAEILDRIHSVPDDPNRLKKQMSIAQKEYFTSEAAKVIAAFRVMGIRGIGGKAGNPVTLTDVLEIAAKVDVLKPCFEPVRVFFEPKDKGGFRPLCDFGPQWRAQQTLVADVLLAAGIDNEFDFTRKGAGGEIALRDEVINALEDGYEWWWTADVINCFSSLKPGHFKWIPMDRIIMRNVVYIPKCAKVQVRTKGNLGKLLGFLSASYPDLMALHGTLPPKERIRRVTIDVVRRGLPQGSCLSNVLARAFIGRELRELLKHFDARPVCWIDDLAIGFDTKQSAKAAEGFLLEQFLQQPAGQVQLHHSKLEWAESKYKRITILGYVFKPGRGFGGSPVHVVPGSRRIERHKRKLSQKLTDEWESVGPFDIHHGLHLGDCYAKQWFGSMRAWTKVPKLSRSCCMVATTHYVDEFLESKKKAQKQSEGWSVS